MASHLDSRIDANGLQALLNSTQSLEPKAVGIQVLVMTVLSVRYFPILALHVELGFLFRF